MAIKKIKLPGMAQPVDIGTTWANVSGKPDLMTSSEITAAINAAFATNDAMVFKGTIGSGGTVTQLPATHQAGWTYKVISNGSLAGQTCEIGDMIVCIKDGTVANSADWTIVQTNVDGVVIGPASSTAGHIATFTGTTGKAIQDSGFTIATSVPANAKFTDTDTKVTSAANHYTPSKDNNSTLSIDASSTTAATWNSTSLVTGVNVERDTKGHITGLTVDSIKMPANPNTWRGIQNNLTSDSTTDSLSAAQGKALKALIDGKTSNTGTVTSVATGVGLTGGSITTSGTIKAKLRSETALTNDSAAATETAGRIYPVAVDKTGYLAVNVPWTDNNTDTKVTQTAKTDNVEYPLLAKGTSAVTTVTDTSNFVDGVTINPSTKTITASNFVGNGNQLTNLNTQALKRPIGLNGVNDITYQSLINDVRANRLAFLPADQIIIEKTTDGGATWVDAEIPDSTKVALFSQTRPGGISLPLINGEINIKCGLRITFTAMKYNVPEGTTEVNKYNYWNSNYIKSTERYNQIKNMYFWVSTATNAMKVTVQRATGADPNNWYTAFNKDNYGLMGWSGNDIIEFSQGVFGGGTTQVDNYWNWRIILMTCGPNGSSTLNQNTITSAQSIQEIRGYGDTYWSAGNSLASIDHLYIWDYLKNVSFPAAITATNFNGSLNGTADKAIKDESGNNIKASYAASISISDHTVTLKNKNGTSLGTITIPDNNTTYSFTDKDASLSWGTRATIATVGGVDIHVTLPSLPTYTGAGTYE